jgi:16S rRNA (cytosine967-C5)-methyltransferase
VDDLGAMEPKSQRAAPTSPPETAEGMAARTAALAVVEAALARRGGFDEALNRPPFSELATRERAFARALATTTLRHLGPIDAALDGRLQKPPPEAVRWLLRLGAAQVLFMDVAAHAAVSTTVDQAASRPQTQPFKGLVNAVLRALVREGAPSTSTDLLAPPWLLARWRAAYGEETASRLAAAIAEEPATDLTPRAPADLAALAEAMEGEIVGGSVRVRRRGELTDWPDYAAGRWWVQDAAAAVPARLLGIQPGETALDLCAAPGGKTLQLAAAGAAVVALDRSAARLKRVTENLSRIGLTAETVAADGAAWADPRSFDAVLLDAPCTATGTFRRHPDVLWGGSPADIGKLSVTQHRLLDAAAVKVRPGGRLVYCVCSLEPEESETQAVNFLRRHPGFRRAPVAAGEAGLTALALTPDGDVRLLPGRPEQGVEGDGFFAARFVRGG